MGQRGLVWVSASAASPLDMRFVITVMDPIRAATKTEDP